MVLKPCVVQVQAKILSQLASINSEFILHSCMGFVYALVFVLYDNCVWL